MPTFGQLTRGGIGHGAHLGRTINSNAIFSGGVSSGFGYDAFDNDESVFLGNGGSGFSLEIRTNDLNMYLGDQGDGAGFTSLTNTLNLFQGGASDGFDGKVVLNGPSTFGGGMGDGQGWNQVNAGSSLFSGGIGDGYFSEGLANVEGGTIFQGGNGSGFDLTFLASANNLFAGGFGDGFNYKDINSTVSLFGGGLGSGFHSIPLENTVLIYSGGEGQGFHMASFAFGTALPVEWLSFTAERMSESEVELKWTVLEKNNDYFEVLRSDGVPNDFVSKGRLTGNGTSNEFTTYDFPDNNSGAAICYYKIRQVDFDGTMDVSPVVVVTNSRDSQDIIAMYPNPTATLTNLFVGEPRNFEFRLYQASGQLILRKMVENQEGTQIHVDHLPSGIYLLQVLFSDKVWSSKLVVEK